MRPRLHCSPVRTRLPLPPRCSLVLPPLRPCQWTPTPTCYYYYYHHHHLRSYQIRHLWQYSSLGDGQPLRKPSVAIDLGGEEAEEAGWTLPTIYALATPPGKSAVAVVRISGPASLDVSNPLPSRPPLSSPPLTTPHHPQ